MASELQKKAPLLIGAIGLFLAWDLTTEHQEDIRSLGIEQFHERPAQESGVAGRTFFDLVERQSEGDQEAVEMDPLRMESVISGEVTEAHIRHLNSMGYDFELPGEREPTWTETWFDGDRPERISMASLHETMETISQWREEREEERERERQREQERLEQERLEREREEQREQEAEEDVPEGAGDVIFDVLGGAELLAPSDVEQFIDTYDFADHVIAVGSAGIILRDGFIAFGDPLSVIINSDEAEAVTLQGFSDGAVTLTGDDDESERIEIPGF